MFLQLIHLTHRGDLPLDSMYSWLSHNSQSPGDLKGREWSTTVPCPLNSAGAALAHVIAFSGPFSVLTPADLYVEQQAASVSDYTLFPNQSLLSVSESAYSHGVLLPIRLILLHQLCELVSSSSPPNYLCSSLSLDDRIFQLFQLPSTC